MLATNYQHEISTSNLKFILLSVVMFFYVFNIKFINYDFIPTGRLIFIFLLAVYIRKIIPFFQKEVNRNPVFFISLLSVCCWVVLQTTIIDNSDFGLLSRVAVFCAYSLLMAGICYMFFPNVKSFLMALGFACFAQAIMVCFSYFSLDYRIWLSELLVQSGNIPLTYASRVPGFSNSTGSMLSLILSLGVFSFMSLYYLSSNYTVKITYLFLSVFILFSCVFVGKLGMFVGLYFIASIFCLDFLKNRISLLYFFLLAIIFVITLIMAVNLTELSYPIVRTFSLFFTGDDSTLSALSEMNIPKLNIDTILGTGKTLTLDGGNAAGSDIGYVQSYYGFGLVFSIIFYVSFCIYVVSNILSIKLRAYRRLAWVLFLPLFIIELKEPFLFKVAYPLVVLSVIYLARKSPNDSRLYSREMTALA